MIFTCDHRQLTFGRVVVPIGIISHTTKKAFREWKASIGSVGLQAPNPVAAYYEYEAWNKF